MKDILELNVTELSRGLQTRAFSSVEITRAYLDRIAEQESEIGAFITVCEERAMAQAAEADEKLGREGEHSPLLGIPMSLKDNICTEGVLTTCASRMLSDFVPPYSADVYRLLRQCGAVLLGKNNLDEFAMGSSSETSALRRTVNPHDHKRVPGGSSGGSAAAVAAYESPFSLGSDTGGSIRLPASYCGVVGVKPTYGRVSRYGLIPLASSLDQIGPITRTVRDNATVLSAISDRTGNDMTHTTLPKDDLTAALGAPLGGIRIGLVRQFIDSPPSEEVDRAFTEAVRAAERDGARTVMLDLPSVKYALPAYHIITAAEAASNLSRFDGIRFGYRSTEAGASAEELLIRTKSEGFGTEVKRRITLGVFATTAERFDTHYRKAQRARAIITEEINDCFGRCDVIITPTTARCAPRFGKDAEDPTDMYKNDLYTVPASLARLPALSIPLGKDQRGMPLGIQIIAKPFCEAEMYRVAYALESILKGGEQI